MTINNKTFSENLIKIRKQKGLSQKDLAKLTGISPRMIAHYEKHVSYPPLEKIDTLAKALKVDISNLIGLNNKNQKPNNDDDFDIRSLKKFKKILILNNYDRSAVYQMIDLLLQKEEYKNKLKELQEIESK